MPQSDSYKNPSLSTDFKVMDDEEGIFILAKTQPFLEAKYEALKRYTSLVDPIHYQHHLPEAKPKIIDINPDSEECINAGYLFYMQIDQVLPRLVSALYGKHEINLYSGNSHGAALYAAGLLPVMTNLSSPHINEITGKIHEVTMENILPGDIVLYGKKDHSFVFIDKDICLSMDESVMSLELHSTSDVAVRYEMLPDMFEKSNPNVVVFRNNGWQIPEPCIQAVLEYYGYPMVSYNFTTAPNYHRLLPIAKVVYDFQKEDSRYYKLVFDKLLSCMPVSVRMAIVPPISPSSTPAKTVVVLMVPDKQNGNDYFSEDKCDSADVATSLQPELLYLATKEDLSLGSGNVPGASSKVREDSEFIYNVCEDFIRELIHPSLRAGTCTGSEALILSNMITAIFGQAYQCGRCAHHSSAVFIKALELEVSECKEIMSLSGVNAKGLTDNFEEREQDPRGSVRMLCDHAIPIFNRDRFSSTIGDISSWTRITAVDTWGKGQVLEYKDEEHPKGKDLVYGYFTPDIVKLDIRVENNLRKSDWKKYADLLIQSKKYINDHFQDWFEEYNRADRADCNYEDELTRLNEVFDYKIKMYERFSNPFIIRHWKNNTSTFFKEDKPTPANSALTENVKAILSLSSPGI